MINPIDSYVVLKQVEDNTKTASGILVQTRMDNDVYEVISVGESVKWVKVGDKVLHEAYAETKVRVQGEDYVLVREGKILAILTL